MCRGERSNEPAWRRFALDDDVARRIGQELAKRVKHSVGVTIEVEVVAPGSIERSQGQAKRIDDRR